MAYSELESQIHKLEIFQMQYFLSKKNYSANTRFSEQYLYRGRSLGKNFAKVILINKDSNTISITVLTFNTLLVCRWNQKRFSFSIVVQFQRTMLFDNTSLLKLSKEHFVNVLLSSGFHFDNSQDQPIPNLFLKVYFLLRYATKTSLSLFNFI